MWIRIDENFASHPKLVAAGPLGMALQVAALCYANRHLTDGFLPRAAVPTLLNFEGLGMRMWSGELAGGGEDACWSLVVEDLVDAGIWEVVDGGWQIHDYADYQPTKADLEQERAQNRAAAQARWQAARQRGASDSQPTRTTSRKRRASATHSTTHADRNAKPMPDPGTGTGTPSPSATAPGEGVQGENPPAPPAAAAIAPAPPPTAGRPRYDAGPFCVFDWQHEDYQQRLAIGHREDFDLDAWYRQVAGELDARGESLPPRTVHAYLSRRLYADAGLRLPSLTGRSRGHPARASPEDQAAKAARQAGRDTAAADRETALAALLDALAPDERTALEETARDDLRASAPYVTPTPADLRRAMLLELARRYRGQPIPAPASGVATGGEEG